MCSEGYFSNKEGMSSCLTCKNEKGERYYSTIGSSSCDVCVEGYYMNPSGTCRACMNVVEDADPDFPAVECPAPTSFEGNALERLHMNPGYFRFSATSTTGYFCTWPNNCIGGNKTGAALCAEGAGGPLW